MKRFIILIAFLCWCLFTLALVFSLLGIIVLVREDWQCEIFQGEEGESNWLQIGKKLVNSLIND